MMYVNELVDEFGSLHVVHYFTQVFDSKFCSVRFEMGKANKYASNYIIHLV
jgi:hypothetical protein